MAQGQQNKENVLCNYVKWCNGQLRWDITRVTEIDTPNQENLTRTCVCVCMRACMCVCVCVPVCTRYKKFDETSIQRIGRNEIFFSPTLFS